MPDKENFNCVIQGVDSMVSESYCIGNGQVHDALAPMKETSKTLNCLDDPMKVMVKSKNRYVVRRLTPTETERLQGFPDGWTDIGEWADSKGVVHKCADSHRFKAIGNSIALPNWEYVLRKLSAYTKDRKPTMASLFDGIGGFPYIWESINGKGTCLWASEIEDFCIEVTKKRIGE